ncbi:MAG: aminopeptidase [Saprospiraceae bacterium]|nr:aminopeptidase [Saprospiraceae bacterium]
MSEQDLKAYSDLLLDYCLNVGPGEKLYIQSTTLAQPLIKHLYAGALERKSIVEYHLSFDSQEVLFNRHAHEAAAKWINPLYAMAMEHFDTYLNIRAPFEHGEHITMDPDLMDMRRQAMAPYQKIYSTRTGTRSLRRNLCQYPTLSGAQDAGMSLEAYEKFVFESCFLHTVDPIAQWKSLSQEQARVVIMLNQAKRIRYLNARTDISFSVEGRTWINSDGLNNMPSGEVYTSPIEDSVNGHIYFDYPLIYQSRLIQGIYLEVESGIILMGHADVGDEVLQEILQVPGARVFGEAAIGMNPFIQVPTKNILFDEKMAGTVHMAIGQSYYQCGGKNESSIHLDFIADMKEGEIWADGVKIYDHGRIVA